MVVELKLPTVKLSEAIAQAFEYLVNCIENQQEKTDDVEILAFGSNFREIEFFLSGKRISQSHRTDPLELFPEKWVTLEEPTVGFQLLCHVMNKPLPNSKFIKIDGTLVQVVGTLLERDGVGVYVCQHLNKQIAVKVALSKRLKGVICFMEKEKLAEILKLEGMAQFVVPLLGDITVEGGFAMPLGQSLVDTAEQCREEHKEEEEALMSFIGGHAIRLLRGLECLHNHGWCHRDIRPANFVLLDGNACLIDWATAKPLTSCRGESYAYMQGMDEPFWPDPYQSYFQDGRKWDLLCFGYSMLALSFTDEIISGPFQSLDRRREFVEYHGKVDKNKIAHASARLILQLSPLDYIVPESYDDFVAVFAEILH